MDDDNLFCEVANCGQLAHFFIIIKDKTKEKCCKTHLHILGDKKRTIYDIAGYRFISSFDDVAEFEKRKTKVDRGVGNLAALEAKCDSELFEAQRLLEDSEKKAIAVIVRSYQEIRLQLQRKYETFKQQMRVVQSNFEQYLDSKQCELQQTAQQVCEWSISPMSFLGFAIEDCMLEIAKAVGGNWMIMNEDAEATIACLEKRDRAVAVEHLTAKAKDQLLEGHTHLALQLSLYAKELGWGGDIEEAKAGNLKKQVERLTDLLKMFQLATEMSDVEKAHAKSVSLECLEAGLAAKRGFQFSQSLYCLQSAWDILQNSESDKRELVVIGLELGEVLCCYSGKYSEAESMFRLCYDIEAQFDPLSEASMKASNHIAGVFYHSESWNRAEEVCMWVLRTFSSTNHSAEHFWTTLHYLTFSQWKQNKKAEGQAVVEEWKSKEMRGVNELSEALKLTALANSAREQDRKAEAEKLLFNALALSEKHFPFSLLTALDHRLLGILYQDLNRLREAESHFRRAKTIYETISPQSVRAATNLNSIGMLNYGLKRFSVAEEHYNRSKTMYEAVSPQSVQAAANLSKIGALYEAMLKIEDAISAFKAARDIYITIKCDSDAKEAENTIYRLQQK